MELSGKTALITGGAKRVGRALALALADVGCNLLLHYNRSVTAAQQTADEVAKRGVDVGLYQADLSDPKAITRLFQTAAGPVHILVNSAAMFATDTLRQLSLDDWSRTLRVNLRAPVFLTQAFANALPPHTAGAVVNITDWRTARPYSNHFSYTVAKGALDTFTRAAALALAPDIRVNAIAMGAMLPPPDKDESYLDAIAKTLPLQRAGGTDVIAHTLLYLLQNDFVTGEIIRLNGGAHLQYTP